MYTRDTTGRDELDLISGRIVFTSITSTSTVCVITLIVVLSLLMYTCCKFHVE